MPPDTELRVISIVSTVVIVIILQLISITRDVPVPPGGSDISETSTIDYKSVSSIINFLERAAPALEDDPPRLPLVGRAPILGSFNFSFIFVEAILVATSVVLLVFSDYMIDSTIVLSILFIIWMLLPHLTVKEYHSMLIEGTIPLSPILHQFGVLISSVLGVIIFIVSSRLVPRVLPEDPITVSLGPLTFYPWSRLHIFSIVFGSVMVVLLVKNILFFKMLGEEASMTTHPWWVAT